MKETKKEVIERMKKEYFGVRRALEEAELVKDLEDLIGEVYDIALPPTPLLKTEQYKCQSYVEGGEVIDCTCGECF